ncbi:hypothetical protein Ndes2526A_g05108 [Nannochloris sp. 'desiccata']|nr:hypothetical protein KSW81_000075 [Chlorella desiccata (nom. nud.)]
MCQEMREIDFRQHALNTTQRTASGPQINQTVEVNQSMAMMQQAPSGYMAPPTFAGAQLTTVGSQNQQIYRMPSGQLVMVSNIEPVSPGTMVPSSPGSPPQFVHSGSGSFPAQQFLPAPANPPDQQFIDKTQ